MATTGTKVIIAPEIGEVTFRKSVRARRVAIRVHPGAELKIIPGEDHGSYICNSSKLTALLLDFFERIGY